ncbi:MAG: hypothetical protein WA172_00750 [Terriglobales bacterium]
MATTGPAGWDARIYAKAIQYMRHGVDPYAAGIAEQQAFRTRPAASAMQHAPFTYVYSPLTLRLLRLLIKFPDWLLSSFFWTALAAGFLLQLWAGFQLADKHERRWLALLLPAVAFFPGLITDDVILSGNLAYLLYGLILAAAVPGWKRGRWFWYYVAVLAASVFKVQLLTLLAFPVLLGKRQWLPAGSTAAAGLLVIAAQARLWPDLFREQLQTIRIMFDVVPDFGYGPAGILGRALWNRGQHNSPATTILYVAFAAAVGVVLLFVAHRVRENNFSRETWIPVALVGTFLLNPRIMKYDMAAITIPMLLIGWRTLRNAWNHFSQRDVLRVPQLIGDRAAETSLPLPSIPGQHRSMLTLVLVGAGCFLVPNLMTVFGPAWWPVELVVMLGIFAMGISSLDLAKPAIPASKVQPGQAQLSAAPVLIVYEEVPPIVAVEPIA